ncbi:DUF4243 domain-containing protein [Microbispora sp. NEAU-D428]|uniref:questin oxidase family protein n=1 Tax=Microbispora sitophila TaxID=2771537 RepID=UPI0018677EB3|nr:questin oxidase family protein [Microbispora sitophila]MBE3016052.1 DUF4243 domain-containing protein [Microbispora sitophila]
MSDDVKSMLDALDRLSDKGFEFAGHLSNHGPMVADALVALGAGEAAATWCESYRPRLEETPRPRERISVRDDEWRHALGRFERVADWTAFMRTQLADDDWPSVVRRWWARLLPGIAAAGTHGVIRTAHAVRALDRAGQAPCSVEPVLLDELAAGLGYWAARYQTLPGRPRLLGDLDADGALERVPTVEAGVVAPGRGIMGHLALTWRLPGFPDSLESLRVKHDVPTSLSALTAAGARHLLTRMDLAVVFAHLVTAPSAVRFVLPHLPERLQWATLQAIWTVVAGIVATFPRLTGPPVPLPERAPDPADVIDAAVGHGDEHVVKVADAALREYALTGDELYLHAAAAIPRFLRPLRWA